MSGTHSQPHVHHHALPVWRCAVYHFHSLLPDSALKLPSEEEMATPCGVMGRVHQAMDLRMGTVQSHTIPEFFRDTEIKTIKWAR